MAAQRQRLNLDSLVSRQDRMHFFPISYAYNYLPGEYLRQKVTGIDFEPPFCHEVDQTRRHNSIPLYPWSTDLPWYSGLHTLRQNKHWKTNLESTNQLLHLFAEDASLNDPRNTNGAVMADFARRELATCPNDRYGRFGTYMFPDADEMRTALLAKVLLLIILFDDAWEAMELDNKKRIQEEFMGWIKGTVPVVISDRPLQKCISDVSRGLKNNGGTDVIIALTRFCQHSPPVSEFFDIQQYLDYRYEDVAMPYSYACLKFSLASEVDLTAARLKTIIRLIGDHMSIANDLASYEKEFKDFENGRAKHLINIVEVVRKIDFTDSDTAKARCYERQLETERLILEELEYMKRAGELSFLEWEFVDGALAMAAGNVFTSVVISRYGGTGARMNE